MTDGTTCLRIWSRWRFCTLYTPRCVTGEREGRSLVATNRNKRWWRSPQTLRCPHPGPCILPTWVVSTGSCMPLIPPVAHRAPAADTWRRPCRSSKPALEWCPVPCTFPTVTAKDSTRESRYAPSRAPNLEGLLEGHLPGNLYL